MDPSPGRGGVATTLEEEEEAVTWLLEEVEVLKPIRTASMP